jgi:hypothetical protein
MAVDRLTSGCPSDIMPAMAPTTDYLTTTTTAERLATTPKVVRRFITEARLVPADRTPGPKGTMLFRPADVERLRLELLTEAEDRVRALRAAKVRAR